MGGLNKATICKYLKLALRLLLSKADTESLVASAMSAASLLWMDTTGKTDEQKRTEAIKIVTSAMKAEGREIKQRLVEFAISGALNALKG